jgi:hypothetical protein
LARKKYSCDFETTTKLDDCRVWAYGWMEIGNKTNYKIGNNIEEFMDWVEHINSDLFFHNMRFDGEFIVNWLLKNGFEHNDSGLERTFTTTISNMGQWYVVDICYGYTGNGKKRKKKHTVIYDSLKKLPFPVKKIAKDFKLSILKGDIDYHLERPIGWQITEKERAYILNDIQIVAEALEIQFKQGLDRITAGSDSLKGFKSVISTKVFEKHFPVFSKEMDDELRKYYRGGFTWLHDIMEGEMVGHGIVFDVNSLYPSVMYYKPLPYGEPIYFEGEYQHDEKYPLYMQSITCRFELKKGYIPTIQKKRAIHRFKPNEYLKKDDGEPVELYVTNIDLEIMREHYILKDVKYHGGWKFKQKIGLFKDFIDKWMYIKTTSDGAIKQLAKLMLNSLYGKFASNPKVTGKIPYLKPDGSTGYTLPKDDDGKVIEAYKKPIYTPMGVFITSWARHVTITTAQKCFDRIIYCDTDSIHLTGTEIPDAIKDIVDDKKLGYWKHEGTFKRGKFIRQKTYMEEYFAKAVIKDGKRKLVKCSPEEATDSITEVKCAGMPDKIKEKVNFDNFKVGFTSWGKLTPKHVSGGVVLVDTEFTIR